MDEGDIGNWLQLIVTLNNNLIITHPEPIWNAMAVNIVAIERNPKRTVDVIRSQWARTENYAARTVYSAAECP